MVLHALAASTLIAFVPAIGAAPQRIVSLNLCADELVLRLAEPGTVKSVTWLARDPALSNVRELAQAVPFNRGLAEDVLPLEPDLVLTGAYTTRAAVSLLLRLGIPVLELDVPNSIDDALAQIMVVATALGAQARGARLVADISARLAALPPAAAFAPLPIVAVYQPNGFTIGRGSLVHDLLRRAGLRNLAVEKRIDNYGVLPLESLLIAQPDLLVINTAEERGPAMAYEVLRHPALMRRYQGERVVSLPSAWWSCPGPRMVDAVETLQQAAQRLPSAETKR
ncbi:MAG: ABC transporter substrate-binding protein [Burkholderiaceae bacterium]